MSFQLDAVSGLIIFPDGFELAPPYESPRYLEYAAWVSEGNNPTVVGSNPLLSTIDTEVTPAQARTALDDMGLYDTVLGLMADPATPRSIKIKWEFTLSFRRNDPAVIMMAQILGWDASVLDDLFTRAADIR